MTASDRSQLIRSDGRVQKSRYAGFLGDRIHCLVGIFVARRFVFPLRFRPSRLNEKRLLEREGWITVYIRRDVFSNGCLPDAKVTTPIDSHGSMASCSFYPAFEYRGAGNDATDVQNVRGDSTWLAKLDRG
jgi:hypothetical protein